MGAPRPCAAATAATCVGSPRRAHAGTPALLLPVAERSALASLEKLQREGRVRTEGERCARSPLALGEV